MTIMQCDAETLNVRYKGQPPNVSSYTDIEYSLGVSDKRWPPA